MSNMVYDFIKHIRIEVDCAAANTLVEIRWMLIRLEARSKGQVSVVL